MMEKDRRTRMVTSSVKAAPKKGGAGGQFTWGSATEVDWYDPVGLSIGAPVGVVTGPAAAEVTYPQVNNGLGVNVGDPEHFPDLGHAGLTVMSTSIASRALCRPPPPAVPAAPPSWGEHSVRAGMLGEFDGQHPRNMFAKKPHIVTVSSPTEQQQAVAIDWSNAGIPKRVQQSLVHSFSNPAHLSPYVQQPQQKVPLGMLRPPPQPIVPALTKQPVMIQKPKMIKQPGFRH